MALYNKDLYQKGRKFVYHTTPTREEKGNYRNVMLGVI